MRTRILIILLIVSIAFIASISAFYWWFLIKKDRIATGTARPYFPYTDYSTEELNKMYPQTMNENIPTTQSPEQTHAKFISALKAGDFDEAVKCCFLEKDWEDIKQLLNNVKKNNQLNTMLNDLSSIEKDNVLDTIATYIYSGTIVGGGKTTRFMEFVKDNTGIWRIKSL